MREQDLKIPERRNIAENICPKGANITNVAEKSSQHKIQS